MKYYSDEELIEMVKWSTIDNRHEVSELIQQRLEQKDKQLDWSRRRCDAAAEWIGHSVITEAMEEC